MLHEQASKWVLSAVSSLNRHRSWTGRIHVHKHLFVVRAMRLALPPFKFVLYDYGPYSFELDEQINRLELHGLLERSYPKPGYGPRYQPTARGAALIRSFSQNYVSVIDRVASEFGNRRGQELELIATCIWVERIEKALGSEVVSRVAEIKPKYNSSEIRTKLRIAKEIQGRLARAGRST